MECLKVRSVVGGALDEETGRKGSDAGAWLGCVGGYGGTGGEDSAGDVGAWDRGVGGDCEAVVAHVMVDWVEGDGFHGDEELVGTGGGGWAVADGKGGAL